MSTSYTKRAKKRRIHEFLLTFFSPPHKPEHKELNGFILNKYFSNASMKWEVSVYTTETWKISQAYLENRPKNKGQDSLI